MELFRDHSILFVHSVFINLLVLCSFVIVITILKILFVRFLARTVVICIKCHISLLIG